MTMVCCDTPIPRAERSRAAAAALTLDERASRAADRLAAAMKAVANAIASHRRRRAEAAALEALPFDLRKDLGWPAGNTAP